MTSSLASPTRPARPARPAPPYDATLRVVMWLDALLSTVAGLAWVVLLPAVALLDLPDDARVVAATVALGGAVVLGACGAVTFVLLMLRLSRGHYYLPERLRLPLPGPFRGWSNERSSDSEAASAG